MIEKETPSNESGSDKKEITAKITQSLLEGDYTSTLKALKEQLGMSPEAAMAFIEEYQKDVESAPDLSHSWMEEDAPESDTNNPVVTVKDIREMMQIIAPLLKK